MNKYRAKSLRKTGEYDFTNHKIVLHKFDESDIDKIITAISENWCQSENIDNINQNLEIRALIRHELTHFIDTTTTLWGLQYTTRKNLVINSKHKYENSNQAADVFLLNTSEILMHEALFKEINLEKIKYDEIKHEYTYDDRFGTVVWLIFMLNGQCSLKTPISVLSVLESHAVCVELLSKIHDCQAIKSDYLRNVALHNIKQEYNELLNNSKLTEYTALLHICHRHYVVELDLEYQYCLRLLNDICEFSLNLQDFDHMSKLANFIKHTNENRYLADQICHELRRGMSRHYIAFKIILFIYSWVISDQSKTQDKLSIVILDPKQAIDATLEFLELDFSFATDEHQSFTRDTKLNIAKETCSTIDRLIFDDFYKKNLNLLKERKIYEIDIPDFSCFTILTSGEDQELSIFKNTSSIIKNLDKSMDDEIFLDQQLRYKADKKFHMSPEETYRITERIISAANKRSHTKPNKNK